MKTFFGQKTVPSCQHQSNYYPFEIYKISYDCMKFFSLRILNNIKWYEDVNIIRFLSHYGRHLRMGDLLSRKQ
jgi:tyrosyl-tRNA synthetase